MALRIGKANEGGPKKPPVEEALEMPPPVEEIDALGADEVADGLEAMPEATEVMPVEEAPVGGLVDPMAARYFDSTMMCSGCIHFMEPGSCEIVAGPIDPGGICSLFTPDSTTDSELPVEAAATDEVSEELPV